MHQTFLNKNNLDFWKTTKLQIAMLMETISPSSNWKDDERVILRCLLCLALYNFFRHLEVLKCVIFIWGLVRVLWVKISRSHETTRENQDLRCRVENEIGKKDGRPICKENSPFLFTYEFII